MEHPNIHSGLTIYDLLLGAGCVADSRGYLKGSVSVKFALTFVDRARIYEKLRSFGGLDLTRYSQGHMECS